MRLKKNVLIVLLMIGLSGLYGPIYALTIQVGTTAVPGSAWHLALIELDRQWQRITAGSVKLNIHPWRAMGNEKDLIGEMTRGKLDGASFHSRGMLYLCRDVYMFYIPMITASSSEHEYVFKKMKPFFQKELIKKGFITITWTVTGWLRLFSKKPVFYPRDLKEHKLSLNTWNPQIEQVWRDIGFRIAPTDSKDVIIALQSGVVDAFFMSPLTARSTKIYELAPNMSAQKIDAEYWAIVFNREAWDKIPGPFRTPLRQAAQNLSRQLYRDMAAFEKLAIQEMETHDLFINKLPGDAREFWLADLTKGMKVLVDVGFSKSAYNRFQHYINEYRQKEKKQN